MTHDDFVLAAYAAFVFVWVGLIIDTLARVWRAKHD